MMAPGAIGNNLGCVQGPSAASADPSQDVAGTSQEPGAVADDDDVTAIPMDSLTLTSGAATTSRGRTVKQPKRFSISTFFGMPKPSSDKAPKDKGKRKRQPGLAGSKSAPINLSQTSSIHIPRKKKAPGAAGGDVDQQPPVSAADGDGGAASASREEELQAAVDAMTTEMLEEAARTVS